jgi:ribonuclease Z
MIHATLKSKLQEDVCLMLHVENHSFGYLCDCGFASELSVKDCRDTAAIFVSHTHIDHFIHFDHVMRHQLGIGRQVVVCGPRGIAANVQHKLRGFTWNLIQFDELAVTYEVREIYPDGRIPCYRLVPPRWELEVLPDLQGPAVYANEAFSVTTAVLDHGVDSIAYLFTCPAKIKLNAQACPYPPGKWMQALKEAYQNGDEDRLLPVTAELMLPAKTLFQYLEKEEGFRLAYVMDHAATELNFERIRALCHQADEVYIEAYYSLEDRALVVRNHHNMAGISGKLLREAGVKKAVPIHFSRRYQDTEGQKKLLEEFEAGFSREG